MRTLAPKCSEMLCTVSTSAGGPGLSDTPSGEYGYAVAVAGRQRQVVQRRDDGEAALASQSVDQLEHILLMTQVEGSGGLVEEQHVGLLGQGPGHHGPLTLAARQRLHGALPRSRPGRGG